MAGLGALASVATLLGSCASTDGPDEAANPTTTAPSVTVAPETTTTTSTAAATTSTTVDLFAPPAWLGTRVLPLGPDGFGEVQPTPAELDPRHIQQPDVLPAPAGDAFESTVEPVPADVVARSTWSPECPVPLDQLRYVTVTFWGFDGEHHRGELLVNADAANDLVEVFRAVDAARYPIEEIRVVRADELDLPPTGDGNNTSAFVCRPTRGSTSWSQHAYGLAVDVNPFLNPYVKGDLVLPELASAYTDRSRTDPGVLHDGDAVVGAFAAIGWGWGGHWSSLKDFQHFSANER